MKVVLSSSKPSKAPVVPPIPLIEEGEKAYAKGSYTTLKLRSNQAEDGIRDRSPSRGLGDVYKRQIRNNL